MSTLTEQQQEILDHVRRFRITTNKAVEQLLDQTPDGARSVIRRLREAGYLDEARLFGRRSYFHLTKLAARRFYSEPALAGPLGPLALARQFGILAFCYQADTPRQKISKVEFAEEFPDLATRGLQHDYYFVHKTDSETRLGYIHVDTGADYQRIERKIRMSVIGKRRDVPAWRTGVIGSSNDPTSGKFTIAIVTIVPEKAHKLRSLLEPHYPYIPILTLAVPDLANILIET